MQGFGGGVPGRWYRPLKVLFDEHFVGVHRAALRSIFFQSVTVGFFIFIRFLAYLRYPFCCIREYGVLQAPLRLRLYNSEQLNRTGSGFHPDTR